MAQLYTIKCPKCGEEFSIPKGVFMSWDFSQPILEDLRDDSPFNYPNCGHTMCVLDKDFRDHVVDILFAD